MNRLIAVLFALTFLLCGCASSSKGPDNVLVVVNTGSPDSLEVGKYYMAQRAIPARNLCKITCPTDEEIADDVYAKSIRDPIRSYLKSSGLSEKIDYIVLTRGIPIRTKAHWGVDSALTCLSWDENEKMTNPYFREDKPFRSRDFGMYLVTRLDGLTLAEAKALVDRSLAAKPAKGLFLFDASPIWDANPGYKIVNDGMRDAAKILKERGFEVHLDETTELIVRENLMGYYGWGSHEKTYTDEAFRKLRFLPGSIAETAVSTSAFTLTSKRTLEGKRSYITDLVAQGATGVKGYVYEPYTIALAEADVLFDRYTSGRNLAESFYSASRFVHWRDIILGDPLCAPYSKEPSAVAP
jgi:uncharacterized protein (TIGR03790 family)